MKKNNFLFLLIFLTNIFIDCKLSLSYELISKISNPNYSSTIYFYSVNAGGTSGYSYRVTISEETDFSKVNKEKYFFNFDCNHGIASNQINVDWIDSSSVRISFDKNVRYFRKKDEYKTVKIIYEEINIPQ